MIYILRDQTGRLAPLVAPSPVQNPFFWPLACRFRLYWPLPTPPRPPPPPRGAAGAERAAGSGPDPGRLRSHALQACSLLLAHFYFWLLFDCCSTAARPLLDRCSSFHCCFDCCSTAIPLFDCCSTEAASPSSDEVDFVFSQPLEARLPAPCRVLCWKRSRKGAGPEGRQGRNRGGGRKGRAGRRQVGPDGRRGRTGGGGRRERGGRKAGGGRKGRGGRNEALQRVQSVAGTDRS